MSNTVSIIVPIYNTEEYLPRCLDSIMNQTYRDFELILVNDGSTDNSVEVCKKYWKENSNVVLINKENGGLGSARNAGLDRAVGKYIFFVDSDDYIEPECLEKAINTMKTEKADICSFGMIKEYSDSSLNEEIHFYPYKISIENGKENLVFIIRYLLNYRIGWESWNRIFKASIIKENGLRYSNERKVFAEDLLFALKYYLYVKKHVTINECLYHYTQREGSLMKKIKSDHLFNQIEALCDDIYDFYKQKNKILFTANFSIIKYHLYEWHTRIFDDGKKLPLKAKAVVFPNSFLHINKYLLMVRKWAVIDGFVSVGLYVKDDQDFKEYENTINSLLNQRLKKIEILVFSKSKIEHKIKDCRIKYLRSNNSNIYNLVNKVSNGEFIYTLDSNKVFDDCDISIMSDTIKYNNCASYIIGKKNMYLDEYADTFNKDADEIIASINTSDVMFASSYTSKLINIKDRADYMNMIKLGSGIIVNNSKE